MSRSGRCFFAGLRTFEMRMMLGEDYDDHHPHWHPVHDHHEHLRQRLKNWSCSSTASAATQAGHRAVVALQVELCLHAGVAGHHVHPSTCTVTLFSLFSFQDSCNFFLYSVATFPFLTKSVLTLTFSHFWPRYPFPDCHLLSHSIASKQISHLWNAGGAYLRLVYLKQPAFCFSFQTGSQPCFMCFADL